MTHTSIATIATYIGRYDIHLVVLSIIVASVASYTALNLAGRVTVAQGRARKLWLAGGAITMGVGIWSMHFIGMLVYQLPIPMVYDIPTVLVSMVAAVLASGLALFLVSRQKLGWLQLVLGSIFMGLGIATMHYTGMIAMRVEAIAQYNPSLVGLSVAIAICVSGVALWLAFHLRAETTLAGNLRKIASAIVMGHAVAGMHYTGMAAVSFQPLPTNIRFGSVAQPSHTIDNSLLAFEIGIATLVILSLAVLASLFDQRISTETARAEALRQSEERFRSLVQNSSNVIAVIAADGTICYTTSSIKQILGYEPEEWLGSKAFDCVHPDDLAKAKNLLTEALHCSTTNITTEFRLRHADNSWREFEVIANNVLAEPSVAGIVTTYRDITKRKRMEAALSESKRHLQEQNAVLMELARRKIMKRGGDLNAAVREITETATNTLRIERASVWLYNCDRSKIQCIDLYEWSKSHHSQGIELAAVDYPAYFQALKNERTIAAHDAHTDPTTKEFSQFYLSPLGITSMLDAPIWLGGEMVGVVCQEHIGPAREWTLEEQNFAGSIADLVALAIKEWERKRAEEALAKREQYLAALVEVQRGLLTWDGDGNCYTQILNLLGQVSGASRIYVFENHKDEAAKLLMSQRAEWRAKGIHPEIDNRALQNLSYDNFFPRWSQTLAQGEIIAGIVAAFPESERLILEPQGILSILILPLIVNDEFFGFIGFDNCVEARAWDILEVALLQAAAAAIALAHERQQAQIALRQAEAKYRSIFENTVEGIFQTTVDGHYVSANPALARIYGYESPEELIPSFCNIEQQLYVKPNRRAEFVRLMQQHDAVSEFESQVYCQDGSAIWISENARTIRDASGQVVGYEGTVRDITARKQAEEIQIRRSRQAALRAKVSEAFAASDTLRGTLQPCCEGMFQHLDAAFARIWTLNEEENVLELQGSAGMYTYIDGSHSRVPVGKFKIGLIAQERQPYLSNDLQNDPRVGDKEWAKREGMVAFAGYPLLVEERLVGVIAMFARETLMEDTLEALTSVADTIAQGIERKRMEKRLQESQQMLQSVMDNTPQFIFWKDRNSVYLGCNRNFAQAAGVGNPENIVGKTDYDLPWKKEESDWYRECDRRAMETGKPEYHIIEPLSRSDGQQVWLDTNKVPLHDSQGSVVGILGTFEDITERKQAEEALHESEKKYRSVVDSVKEVIFQIDAAGAWIFLNRAWTEITGFSVDESIGTQFLSYVCPDDYQYTLDLFQPLIERQKEHCHHEFRCLTQDGSCRWIELHARVTLDALGNVTGISGTLNDITERKKVDRMKNEFVSTVSHELRTPLTSILGSLGLVINGVAGEIPSSAKAMLDIAHKNSERLVRLINDILDIEKIESGKMAFNLQPLELMPLVEQAIAANQAYGEQFGVKFTLENTLIGVKVNADSDRLMQVLTNLLSNAAKFSPPNYTVVISVARHERAIRVAIADRGCGISEEFRNRIFQKFAQADSSDSRQKGGTGLGLSICKAIVEKHHGQIGFATETNAGTTFYFDLPEWYEPAITVLDNSSVPTQLPILICEDDGDIAALLKILLERAGFQADIAYDAAQAKQLLAQNQYAAMTLDIALPDVDGISLLRELRHQDSTRHLPIVVVSAKAELARQELNGNAIAVIDWLDKPIDQTRLITAVKQATQQIASKPRILHIEDNPDVRQVVGAILQNFADICYAVNLQEAQQKLQQEIFDLILLDLSLPDGFGLELLPQLNGHSASPTPVVVFSAQEVGIETVQDVAAVLVKSRTSNQKLLETIKSLTKHSNPSLIEQSLKNNQE